MNRHSSSRSVSVVFFSLLPSCSSLPSVLVSGISPSLIRNNSNIQNSAVGFINTGNLEEVQSIAVNISTLTQSGHAEVAQALAHLSTAFQQSQEITQTQRDDLLENLAELSRQASLGAEKRSKPGVLKSLISGIARTISTAGGLAEVWNVWGTVITKFFGLSS